MTSPRQSAIALALALVDAERGTPSGRGQRMQGMTTKLEGALGRLIGANGFDVLLSRALKLAAREHKALADVTASPGGELLGLPEGDEELEQCMVALLTHLCELLMKFIGEDLATRVFRDVWPAATHPESKEKKP